MGVKAVRLFLPELKHIGTRSRYKLSRACLFQFRQRPDPLLFNRCNKAYKKFGVTDRLQLVLEVHSHFPQLAQAK